MKEEICKEETLEGRERGEERREVGWRNEEKS